MDDIPDIGFGFSEMLGGLLHRPGFTVMNYDLFVLREGTSHPPVTHEGFS
jgi:hypothetical protein